MNTDETSDDRQPRSRGRKSKQRTPSRRGSPLKWVLITCGSLLLLLFIGLFAASTIIRSWLHGEGFRNRLVSKLETALNSEVQVEALRWQESSLYIAGIDARGYRDAAISKLEIDGIRGTFDGAENQAWQIPDVTMNQLSVEFSGDRLPHSADVPSDGGSGGARNPDADVQSIPSFLRKWVPQSAEIGVVRIDATNLLVKNSAGGETFSLRAVETASKPIEGSQGGWRIQGRGGDMHVAGQPKMRVEGLDLRWTGSDIFLNHATLGIYKKGRIEADGELFFGKSDSVNLRLNISGIECAEVLDETWKDRVSGTLSGTIEVAGSLEKDGALTQSGRLRLTDGILRDLPVLKKISSYTRSPKFHPLMLHDASFEFERNGNRLIISDLVLESNGLTRLEGTLTLDGDVIEVGEFRLGVTPGTLSMIPGAERKVFTVASGGFLWTDVSVAGTLSQPQENLSQRLVGAAIESVIEDAPGKVLDTARDVVKDPTGAAGGLLEQGGELLKGFAPFLKYSD